jgi:hypothetical protein
MGALTKINVQHKIPIAKFKMGQCDFQDRSSGLETGQHALLGAPRRLSSGFR